MLKIGINLNKFLESDLVLHKLNFEEWPSTCKSKEKEVFPYNGSLFKMRAKYNEIVGDEEEKKKEKCDDEDK